MQRRSILAVMAAAVAGAGLHHLYARFLAPRRIDRPWLQDYFTILPAEAEIVMLGDSLTARGLWSEHFPGRRTVNRGVPGDTTAHVLARLDEVLRFRPRVIVLMVGINDLRMGVAPAVAAERHAAILARLSTVPARLIVHPVLAVAQDSDQVSPIAIADLNRRIVELAAARGASLLDLNPLLAPQGHLLAEYTIDGIHLTGAAYLRWADALRPVFEKS